MRMNEPTNRLPTCQVCGEPIDESQGEVPVYTTDIDVGEYDGEAYHLNKCEDGVFETVYVEVTDPNKQLDTND